MSRSNKKSNKSKKIVIMSLKIFMIIFLVAAIVGAAAGTIVIAEVIKDIPKEQKDNFLLSEQTVIYDRNGEKVYTVGDQRASLKYEEIPEILIEAIIATEDSRFFAHGGVDKPRFVKASMQLGQGGGASTITMQSSKNAYTNPDKESESSIDKFFRKIQDLYVSTFIIEEQYTKEEIFAFYVNSQYLGNFSYGIQAAAHNYFNKDVKDLNLAEAAFIGGLFQSPSTYNPVDHGTKVGENRRNNVLSLMVRHEFITEEQANLTKEIPLASYLNPQSSFNISNPEYTDYINAVIQEVKDETGYDPYQTPMKIYTNMDTDIQKHVYSVKTNEKNWANEKLLGAATIIDNSDGTVVAMMSGQDVNEVGFNYATSTHQPGSSVKPVLDYGPCFEQNICTSINETIVDEPYKYSDGTKVNNYDNKYRGTITIKEAVADSRNIPAIKTFQKLNKDETIDMAKSYGLNLGIDPKDNYFFEAHAIGGYNGESTLTLAGAYSAYARGGLYSTPTTLDHVIVNYHLESSKNFNLKSKEARVMKESTADSINQILSVKSGGFGGSWYARQRPGGANYNYKSGTTNWDAKKLRNLGLSAVSSQAMRDLWATTYTPEYTTSVWVGYDVLNAEYAKNGWYINGVSYGTPDRIMGQIVRGEHQPKTYTQFPGAGSANTSKIVKEVEEKDKDNDGVFDYNDDCADTPAGSTVDEKGCIDKTKDSDNDGVMDFQDNCPNTESGAVVDQNGCSTVTKPDDPTTDPTEPEVDPEVPDVDSNANNNKPREFNSYMVKPVLFDKINLNKKQFQL